MSFTDALIKDGWVEEVKGVIYTKSGRKIIFDTSSWMEIGTERTEKVFDVPVPSKELEAWSLNLINHLCETDERLNRK